MSGRSGDIAIEGKRAELLLRFREVARLIGQEQDPKQLLRSTCELLVELDVFEACIITLTRGERPGLTAAAGTTTHLQRVLATLDAGGLTPCMQRAAEQSLVTHHAHDLLCSDCPAGVQNHDHEAVALPLDGNGQTHGVLLALWPPGAGTDELRALLGEVCGDLARALGSMEASRQRDETSAELRRTRDRLDALIAASPAAIVSLDPQGDVVSWSRGAEQIFGWRAEETLGKPLPFIPADKQEQFRNMVGRVLRGESISQLEVERRRRDGTMVAVSLSAAPLRESDGSVAGVMAVIVDLSEQRRVELSLQQSEVQLSTLLANLPGMAYRCRNDRDWTMAFVSEGCIELTGHTPAELVDNSAVSYADLIHPDDRQRVWEQVQVAIDAERPFLLEYRLRTADGSDKWVWEQGRTVRGSDGKLWLEGLVTDISRGKHSELALIDRVEDLRCLLDTAKILASDVSRQQALASVAQRIPNAFRHPERIVVRIRIGKEQYASPDFSDTAWCTRATLHSAGQEVGTIEICHLGSGDEVSSVAREDQLVLNGIADQLSGFLEREHITEALRASEAKSRALYQRLPIPTFVWRRQGDDFLLVDCNESALRATNGKVRGWLGQLASASHHDRPDVTEDLRRCLAEESSFQREMTYHYRESDEHRQLVVTYGFVAPDMVLVHTQDVTDQRQMEEQLRLAQKLEAIGRLAGGIAHDFNNILTVISSCADFALDGLDDATRARKDLHEIRKATDRAAALTRQLLAFSRKQILRPAVLDLNQVASDMENMLRRLLGEDVLLETRLAQPLGRVRADRGQLEQVIMNIAVNARDAMPEGGTLLIETANRELDEGYAASHPECQPGPHVMMRVTDDGCGMTAETVARVFEPFFTTKGPGKGTGLGLSTAYGIVAQSGGSIAVQSEPGAGASVHIYLPQVQDSVSPSAPPQELATPGHETVLLVEDEATVRSLVARILELAGYDVIVASGGSEALRLAESHRGAINLLLTDVIMPRMSGREVAETLTRRLPELRVLYMSGYTDDAIVHHGVLREGTHFLGKPFSREQLLAKVREVLVEPSDAQPSGS